MQTESKPSADFPILMPCVFWSIAIHVAVRFPANPSRAAALNELLELQKSIPMQLSVTQDLYPDLTVESAFLRHVIKRGEQWERKDSKIYNIYKYLILLILY